MVIVGRARRKRVAAVLELLRERPAIKHRHDLALRLRAACRVVDIRDEETLDTFFGPIQCSPKLGPRRALSHRHELVREYGRY